MIWHYAKQVLAGLAIVMIAGLGITAVATKAQHGQLLSVQTGSMIPNLNKGDLVQVTRVSASELQKGDIVTFINPKDNKTTITHRIIELPNQEHPGRIVTKGDANPAADQPVSTSKIVGKVNWHVPYAGKAVDFVRKPIGLIALIYIPALLVIIGELKRLAKHYEMQKPYLNPWRERPKPEANVLDKVVSGLGYVFIIAVMTLLGSLVSVRADLMSRATLAGNTIKTASVSNNAAGLLISRLSLTCTRDNTVTASQRPRIRIYNPTNQSVNINNWKLQDNSGVIATLPSKTLKPKQSYTIRLFLPTGGQKGLQFAGDRLALANPSGQVADGLNWGLDTTYFSPSLPNSTPGTRFIRKDQKVDTNKASDWKVSDARCAGEHKETGGHGGNEDGEDDEDNQDPTCNPTTIGAIDIRETP